MTKVLNEFEFDGVDIHDCLDYFKFMNKNIKGSITASEFDSVIVNLALVYANQLSKFIKSRKNVYTIDVGDLSNDIINCLLDIIQDKVNKNPINTFCDKVQLNLLDKLYDSFQVYNFYYLSVFFWYIYNLYFRQLYEILIEQMQSHFVRNFLK